MTNATPTNATPTAGLKPSIVWMRGGWIEVCDRQTGESVKCFNIPTTSKNPNHFTHRVLRAMAALGYDVRIGKGMGGHDVVMIGDCGLEDAQPAPGPAAPGFTLRRSADHQPRMF